MKFTPMTEAEIVSASLLEAGEYPFEVLAASEEISKAGNEMIRVKLAVFGPNGQQAHVYDYLMEKMAFKLRRFCETTGLLAKYEAGTLGELDCEGKKGTVKIAIESANGKYNAKNVVKDYLKPEVPLTKPAATSGAGVAGVPRKLKPEEFNAKHGIDTKAVMDDDLDIPF